MLKLLCSGAVGGADRTKSFGNQQPVKKRLPGEKLSFTSANVLQLSPSETRENLLCAERPGVRTGGRWEKLGQKEGNPRALRFTGGGEHLEEASGSSADVGGNARPSRVKRNRSAGVSLLRPPEKEEA